ncbi:ABC transporter ATP-binding protein, partial [Dermabacter sp.]
TGLLSPDGGEVQLLGADPLTHDAETRARVGVMLQDGGLTSGATPAQLLAYASSLYARPRDWRALSRELGIDSFSSTLVRRLSGGQRQRLSLALSLLGVPDVLFLDEPTAGMDVAVKRRTRELIRAEAERGAAVILTSHALDDIASLADRVIVIAEGSVKADGTLADVERTLGSQSPLSIDIAASAPSEERLVAFEQAVRNAAEIQGVTLAIEHGPDSLEDILVSLSNTRAKETK